MSTKIDAPADDITLPALHKGIDSDLAVGLRAYARRAILADRASPSRAAVPTPRDEDQRTRGHMGSTPDGGIDDHDEPNLPESLTLEVDAWFERNTGLGGCSDKDAAELAAIFYDVTYEGGRESVEDALSVVESFGPSVQGLNDTFARQVLLASEVRRLHNLYASPAAVDVGAAQAETAQAAATWCQCPACAPVLHASDCAVHNAPALPVGSCDCGAAPGLVPLPATATKEMMAAAVKFANGDAVYKNVAAGALEIEEQIYGETWEAMVSAFSGAKP